MTTLRDFAKPHGFTKAQALDLAQRGLILGAEQNPFSKQWRVEAPARLVEWLEALDKPERDTQGAALPSSAGVMGATHADTHPHQTGLADALLFLADQQAPQGLAVGFALDGAGDAASPEPQRIAAPAANVGSGEDGAAAVSDVVPVYRRPEVQICCRNIQEAAQRSQESFSFTFTEAQRHSVSHALMEIATELEDGEEAHDPWIQEEIARLWAVRDMLEKAFYQRRAAA